MVLVLETSSARLFIHPSPQLSSAQLSSFPPCCARGTLGWERVRRCPFERLSDGRKVAAKITVYIGYSSSALKQRKGFKIAPHTRDLLPTVFYGARSFEIIRGERSFEVGVSTMDSTSSTQNPPVCVQVIFVATYSSCGFGPTQH